MSKPIFIFSAGWRSGSTMLQRMLTATGEVLIWGEPGGAINCIVEAIERYKQMLGDGDTRYEFGFGGNGGKQLEEFNASGQNGVHNWIACMNPPESKLMDALKNMLDLYYGKTAEDLCFNRWGFKEVQSGKNVARSLLEIYPNAKIIFLIRNPIDCLLSIKRRNWMDNVNSRGALKYYAVHWRKMAEDYRQASFGKIIYYEELVSSKSVLKSMLDYLEIENIPDGFLDSSRADWKAENNLDLTRYELWYLLRIVGREMKQHGYSKRKHA